MLATVLLSHSVCHQAKFWFDTAFLFPAQLPAVLPQSLSSQTVGSAEGEAKSKLACLDLTITLLDHVSFTNMYGMSHYFANFLWNLSLPKQPRNTKTIMKIQQLHCPERHQLIGTLGEDGYRNEGV